MNLRRSYCPWPCPWLMTAALQALLVMSSATLAAESKPESKGETRAENKADTKSKPVSRLSMKLPLFHPLMRNPALFYRVASMTAGSEVSLIFMDDKVDRSDSSQTESLRGINLGAGIIFRDAALDLRFGLTMQHTDLRGHGRLEATQVGTGTADGPIRSVETVVTPMLSLPIAPHLSAGMAYDVTHYARSGGYYDKTHDLSYSQARLGLVWLKARQEMALSYESLVNKVGRRGNDDNANTQTMPRVAKASKIIAHYAQRVSNNMEQVGAPSAANAYAEIAAVQNSKLNTDGQSGWKNSLEGRLGYIKLYGNHKQLDLGFELKLAAYQSDDDMAPDNIMQYELYGRYSKSIATGSLSWLASDNQSPDKDASENIPAPRGFMELAGGLRVLTGRQKAGDVSVSRSRIQILVDATRRF